MPDMADVVVVGGGILGLSTAYELTRKALRVVLLEAGGLAGRATGNGFAWVNATAKWEDADYHRLNAQGVKRYRALAAEWGAERIGLHGGGALVWAEDTDPAGAKRVRRQAAWLQHHGYPVAML